MDEDGLISAAQGTNKTVLKLGLSFSLFILCHNFTSVG